MVKKIIKINEVKCNGCGLCADTCHGGAIGIIGGKAKLLREDFCDGLGNCLPVCPNEAISFAEKTQAENFGCPGIHSKKIERENDCENLQKPSAETHLNQWPVQIKLVPPNAPYFNNADLLIAADCSAYAYGNFHNDFMKNKITIIGCPKLDESDYSEKLTAILTTNEIKSVTVTRMEVPCCGGIENAVKTAHQDCGKMIPLQVVIIRTDGVIRNTVSTAK